MLLLVSESSMQEAWEARRGELEAKLGSLDVDPIAGALMFDRDQGIRKTVHLLVLAEGLGMLFQPIWQKKGSNGMLLLPWSDLGQYSFHLGLLDLHLQLKLKDGRLYRLKLPRRNSKRIPAQARRVQMLLASLEKRLGSAK